jgi:hypothetical protein
VENHPPPTGWVKAVWWDVKKVKKRLKKGGPYREKL